MFGIGKQTARITEEQVIAALSKVNDTEIHRDLVTLGMIRDITIDGGAVGFTVVLTTPACPLKHQIEDGTTGESRSGFDKVTTGGEWWSHGLVQW